MEERGKEWERKEERIRMISDGVLGGMRREGKARKGQYANMKRTLHQNSS